jgi:energy-converting hydrogenase Eha subunit C
MNKVILASLVILGLVSVAMADNYCTSYTCGTLAEGVCGEYNMTGKAWTL